jgi:hypothetical protein
MDNVSGQLMEFPRHSGSVLDFMVLSPSLSASPFAALRLITRSHKGRSQDSGKLRRKKDCQQSHDEVLMHALQVPSSQSRGRLPRVEEKRK